MKMLKTVASWAIVLTHIMTPSLALAYATTVGELKDKCEQSNSNWSNATQAYESGACLGFIEGVTITANLHKKLCIPSNVALGQNIDIFIKWARENPEMYHIPAAIGVIESIHKVFPCKAPK